MKPYNTKSSNLRLSAIHRRAASGITAILLLLLATPAFAASMGGAFSSAAAGLWGLYCDFTHSPILAFVVIVIAVSLLIGMGSGEENSLISKFLKWGIMAVLLLSLPAIAEMVGYSVMSCQ